MEEARKTHIKWKLFSWKSFSRRITIDVTYRGQRTRMGTSTSLAAKAKINRHDFGLGQGMAIQFAASEMATIQIDLEAVQTSAQAREAVALAE